MNQDITTPTLILDTQKCQANIQMMVDKAKRQAVLLRPHCKTHQSHEVARWFRALGVDRITVSSLKMAEYFAEDAWSDITVAFPTNILEIARINRLAGKIKLNLVLESFETLTALQERLTAPVSIYLKVDIGYRRTGIPTVQYKRIEALLAQIDAGALTSFEGFLGHAGHSYKARGVEEIAEIHEKSKAQMLALKQAYLGRYPGLIASIGDTPTCSRMEDFSGVDEIRPGNFVFYDITQQGIGSCDFDQIAVAMACPVVAKHADRSELVLYGGGVHLSKDRLSHPEKGTIFGLVAEKSVAGTWGKPEGSYLRSLSQEHGIVKATEQLFQTTKIGDLLMILPVHSCMSANLMKEFWTSDGQKISMLH